MHTEERPFPGVRRCEVAIPKIVMQTWKTKDVPDKWKNSKPSVEKALPGWKHVHMSDEDNRKFVAEFYPSFLSYYDAFPYGIQRADAVRYCWLHKYGGVYIDYDTEAQHNMEDLFLHGEIFFIRSPMWNRSMTNSLMASVPGHPIWLEMIEEMKKPISFVDGLTKELTVLGTTGPNALDRVLRRTKYPYVQLPSNVLRAGSYCGTCENPHDYVKDMQGRSWVGSWTANLYQVGYCYMVPLIVLVIVVLLLLVIILGYWLGSRRVRVT